MPLVCFVLLLIVGACSGQQACAHINVFVRFNHVGYLPEDFKEAVVFSNTSLDLWSFVLRSTPGKHLWGPFSVGDDMGAQGRFVHHYRLPFSAWRQDGPFVFALSSPSGQQCVSKIAWISSTAYHGQPDNVLRYIRQQRCGYNPFLDKTCHLKDGRSAYGSNAGYPNGTFVNVTGGWHDAADLLRYMLTSGNSVGRMLFAYRENPDAFGDYVDEWGHAKPNGIPDVLDEAKWGLDWMLRMHPTPDTLFAQVADDRDHEEFVLPPDDTVDYGWGPGSYRVIYYATGKRQGLRKWKNNSTGIANLAGRYAAAMAMASTVKDWKSDFGQRCLQAGKEVYDMGVSMPGCEEGTPCISPYRYTEVTWTDDMEWGAAELYRATKDSRYLTDAIKYAGMAGSIGWTTQNVTLHYQWYPFVNLGHYSLFPFVNKTFGTVLANYYREGLANIGQEAEPTPYRVAHPFFWCSNNFAASLVTHELLYRRMSNDSSFRSLGTSARDWILGRNPWGVAMVMCAVSEYEPPLHPQSTIQNLTGRPIFGGLVDGPMWTSMWNTMKGIVLTRADPYKEFQSKYIVYHDDTMDYATNEPTLDGSAETLHFFSSMFH